MISSGESMFIPKIVACSLKNLFPWLVAVVTQPITHDPCRKPSYVLFDIRCVKQCSLFNGFLRLLFSVSRLYDMEVRGSRPSSSASSNQMNHGELVSKQPGYFLVPLVLWDLEWHLVKWFCHSWLTAIILQIFWKRPLEKIQDLIKPLSR